VPSKNRLFQVSWFGSERLATALTSHDLSYAKPRFALLPDQTFST
jgi:hypothetical protein